ncbi:MAG: type II secretion system protein GspN [Anaeromyxobacter sp.]|nr:type II secretion system protein GspN [Anaeromyxobacter sp.]MBL0275791.1 type II secretion system protein GspN [Anaeromyxobacter sp.]
MAIDWTTWKPRLLYGAFFVAAFLLALRQTLPAAAMRDRLVVEAAQRGWKLEAGEAGPAGLVGVGLRDVSLKDKDGLAIPMEELDVTLAALPLLRGRLRVAVAARLYDGRATGSFDLSGAPQVVEARLSHLDLAQAVPLRKAAGLDLTGLATGTARFVLPADEKGKLEGRADLTIEGAGLAGGKVPVPGMAAPLTLPALSLGQVTAAVAVAAGKGTFEKLASSGGDATLAGDGLAFTVLPKLDLSPLTGRASIRLSEAFAAKAEGKTVRSLLDLALASGKGKDGAWHLAVAGTLGHPSARPAPPPAAPAP